MPGAGEGKFPVITTSATIEASGNLVPLDITRAKLSSPLKPRNP